MGCILIYGVGLGRVKGILSIATQPKARVVTLPQLLRKPTRILHLANSHRCCRLPGTSVLRGRTKTYSTSRLFLGYVTLDDTVLMRPNGKFDPRVDTDFVVEAAHVIAHRLLSDG